MYHFKILNQIKLDYFFKFVVHKLNSKIVKSKIMILAIRKNIDMTDAYMTIG
jgi:hypothetical protein